jgi:uncharacterized membrane protein (UPF0127 family)
MLVFSVGSLTLDSTIGPVMDIRSSALYAGLLVAALLVGVFLLNPPLQFVDPGEYDRTTVSAVDQNGTELATVDVRVADTRAKRRVGLMRSDTLANDSGMLFVHPSEGRYSYHMRNMDFDIDIVFVGANGTITTIHHATAPAQGEDSDTYSGTGKYVLEVPRGYTNANGIGVGDSVVIPADLS